MQNYTLFGVLLTVARIPLKALISLLGFSWQCARCIQQNEMREYFLYE